MTKRESPYATDLRELKRLMKKAIRECEQAFPSQAGPAGYGIEAVYDALFRGDDAKLHRYAGEIK